MRPDLQDLHRQLRERFPEAHQSTPNPATLHLSAGLPTFPAGALSELSPAGPASGLSLVLAKLLQTDSPEHGHESQQREHQALPPATTSRHREPTSPPLSASGHKPLGLIDGCDSFDPASYGSAACSRLLWIRCHHAEESLRCTDLLLRDGNLPLLVLDLQLTPLAQLRKLPTSSWYRLRNLAKQSGAALLVFTPGHLIPCAALQLSFDSAFSLSDLERDQTDLSPLSHHVSQTMTALS